VILVGGFIAEIAAGCSSVASLTGANARQPVEDIASSRAGDACFYSNDFGTERSIAGRVLHWCGPEPRAVN
jgi:hypothetical protein